MHKFSDISLKRLATVHPDLQTLFLEVIKHRDCSIVSGMRTTEQQKKLYAQGRTEPGDIVTHKDGEIRISYHQTGHAVDVIPYPEKYDEDALRDFGCFVKGIAVMLKKYRTIDSDIDWGFDLWGWDKPHWQV